MIRHEYLPWTEHALPAAARFLAEERAADGTLDLQGSVVALPAARAGRRLLELLVDESDARGLILLPPRITTLKALPEQLYEPPRPLADDTLARRVWSRALRGLEPEARSAVFPEPPAPDDLPAWDRIARLVLDLHREIAGRRLDFDDVAAACREMGADTEVDRWRALASAGRACDGRLERLGLIDRDGARLRALASGDVGAEVDLWLLGVVELPAVTRRLIEAAAEGSA
ncbi:MAG: hypothetical protein ACOC83_10015, partial [Gemmatimonadota bacterium]